MRPAKRVAACLIVIAACAAVLLSVRDRPRARPEEGRNHAPPSPDVEILRRRISAKDQVVDQLLAGELSLAQAAARFKCLNEDPPHLRVPIYLWPGKSEGEKVCRQVINWIESRYQSQGMTLSEAQAAVSPFERELKRLMDENGEIHLPPVE